jgi:hypothetical protein
VKIDAVRSDGSRLATMIEQRRGSADHPLTASEIEGKFRRLAGTALTTSAIDELADRIDALDREADLRRLSALVTARVA